MSNFKEIKLDNGRSIDSRLSHETNSYNGYHTLIINGNVSLADGAGACVTNFLTITTHNLEIKKEIILPTYEIIREDLWCPILMETIVKYLQSILYLENQRGKDLLREAIPFIIKRLENHGKMRKLGGGHTNFLVGELEIHNCFEEIQIIGHVSSIVEDKGSSLVFLKIANFNCPWRERSYSSIVTTWNFRHYKNKKLINLMVAFLAELENFTDDKDSIRRAIVVLTQGSRKSQFCNQLRDRLLKTDKAILTKPEVTALFVEIAKTCGFKLDTSLLAHAEIEEAN